MFYNNIMGVALHNPEHQDLPHESLDVLADALEKAASHIEATVQNGMLATADFDEAKRLQENAVAFLQRYILLDEGNPDVVIYDEIYGQALGTYQHAMKAFGKLYQEALLLSVEIRDAIQTVSHIKDTSGKKTAIAEVGGTYFDRLDQLVLALPKGFPSDAEYAEIYETYRRLGRLDLTENPVRVRALHTRWDVNAAIADLDRQHSIGA